MLNMKKSSKLMNILKWSIVAKWSSKAILFGFSLTYLGSKSDVSIETAFFLGLILILIVSLIMDFLIALMSCRSKIELFFINASSSLSAILTVLTLENIQFFGRAWSIPEIVLVAFFAPYLLCALWILILKIT